MSAQINLEKQPKGLYLLFFTELWERFGFYTLQTIIILYMTKGLYLPDQQANLLYAAFSSLLYLTPTLGGYLADRFLGFQRSINIGGILFIIAYILCAFHSKTLFFIGLGTLICANGLFKPSVSSIVGDLYERNDARRDGGFTLFYMGINVGALIPPLISGALVDHYGWHAGFILAAIGMLLGQIIFTLGKKYLYGAGSIPKNPAAKGKVSHVFYLWLSLGIIGLVWLCQISFRYPTITNSLVELCAVGITAVVLYFISKESLLDRKRMIASLVLIGISVAFWALYNQTFTSLMLFADRNMVQHVFGIPLNAEATQFFNPFFIIALSPILSRLWIRMDQQSLNPSIQMKFALGVFFMCLGYLILGFGTHYFSVDGLTSPSWLIASYFLQTIGELLISPIGLAMITVLCPKHLVGMMMGVWFFAQAAAFAIGGTLANIAAVPDNASVTTASTIYSHAFVTYGLISLAMTLACFALIPFLNRMIKQ